MWGRGKNFHFLMIFELKNCENKLSISDSFFGHHLKTPIIFSIISIFIYFLLGNSPPG